MSDIIINIIFYVLGLLLAALPIIIEFHLKQSPQSKKPTSYKIFILFIVLCLFILGIVKILKDYGSQQTEIGYRISSKRQIESLSTGINSISISFKYSRDSTKKFQDSLLKDFGIIRNSKNLPEKKIFNNKMRDVGTLIEQ